MAHDLSATRRIRKGILATGVTTEARPASEVSPAAAPVMTPLIGERVVADVRHEVGNHLHKLYYWADFLTESRNGHGGDVTATQMLEETIRGLEELLRATLEYVRPMTAAPIHMPLGDVVDGIDRQLRASLARRDVATTGTVSVATERTVLLDPGRLSQLLGMVARRIEAVTEGSAALTLQRVLERRGNAEVLTVDIMGASAGTVHSTLADVEWASAENVARLVGGDLTCQDAGGIARFTLVLSLLS